MIENHEKITKEFCQEKRLLFFPETAAEAMFIRRQALEMGYSDEQHFNIVESVSKGMVLRDGKIYTAPGTESLAIGLLCTSEQFAASFDKNDFNNLSGDALAREIFNRISTRLDAIEKQLGPQTLDKPALSRKAPGAGP